MLIIRTPVLQLRSCMTVTFHVTNVKQKQELPQGGSWGVTAPCETSQSASYQNRNRTKWSNSSSGSTPSYHGT